MTTLNTDEIKIPALSLAQINQRFGANKNMVAFLHTDRKNNEYMFFIDVDSLENFTKIRNTLHDESKAWDNQIFVYARQAVPPRAGCLDGNINSFQKWKAVYARSAELLTDPAQIIALNDRDLNNRFPSVEEALIARLPEQAKNLNNYLVENNILSNTVNLSTLLNSGSNEAVLFFCLKLDKHFRDPVTTWANIHTKYKTLMLQRDETIIELLDKVIVR